MKLLYRPIAICIVTMIAALSLNADAARFKVPSQDGPREHPEVVKGREFKGATPFAVDAMNFGGAKVRGRVPTRGDEDLSSEIKPSTSFDELPEFGYLEGPDGSTWFYISEFTTEEVAPFPEFPDYTEETLTAFKFTIYDNLFNEAGTISDRIKFGEGETRAVSVSIDPTVSTRFFNTDAKPEIMVFFAMNTTEYINHYYYKVYSIDGEKTSDGYDKALMSLEGLCVDAVNAGKGAEDEDFYYTFQSDTYINLDDEYEDYVDFLNRSYAHHLATYTKATENSGPKVVLEKDILYSCVPGDTTYNLYIMTKPFGGKVYFIYSYYEKPFFVDPTGMAEDESATPDNSLMIDTYSLQNGSLEKVASTQVKVNPVEIEGSLVYTYLSIGSVANSFDVDMVVNGTPESPAYIVSVDVQNAAEYEELISSGYYVFGADGKLIKELATDTNGMVLFSGANESEPELMYVKGNATDGYIFEFSKLYHGGVDFTIDQDNGGDPISARCDRVPMGDGSFKYAFEMTYYETDEEGCDRIRVAWFDQNGKFERIDKIFIGPYVMAAQVNMASSVLNPHLFDDDDAMEYAVLVKRTDVSATAVHDEFMVVDDNDNSFVTFTEADGRGLPYSFGVLFGDPNRFMMVYNQNYRYNVDLYDLPFKEEAKGNGSGGSGVESIEGEDGEVRYFNLQGVELKNPSKGQIYIKVANGKAVKEVK